MRDKNPPKINKEGIAIYNRDDFEGMRMAGKLAAKTLDMISSFVKPGVTTDYLDKIIHEFIIDNGSVPATLGYRGYPKSCCTSSNHVVCHGIPTEDRILVEGDALNVDVTAIINNHYGLSLIHI
mgnify:CR=1 FL=1